jgi:hypothetical protein
MSAGAGFPEPPAIGAEDETLLGSLERQRATFIYKCADLDREALNKRLGPSALTLGALLKHLAYMEDLNFTWDVAGNPLPEPWAATDQPDRSEWVWVSAADDTAQNLYSLWDTAVDRSRSVVGTLLAHGGMDQVLETQSGSRNTLRRLIVDLIEEYGRHTGHADLIRESIDGRIGEDPPGHPYPYRIAG